MSSKKEVNSVPADKLVLYEKLVATVPGVERKGATLPYTSLNGNMFSALHHDGTLGLRLPAEAREAFITKYETHLLEAYGKVLKEYVAVARGPAGEHERAPEILRDERGLRQDAQAQADHSRRREESRQREKKPRGQEEQIPPENYSLVTYTLDSAGDETTLTVNRAGFADEQEYQHGLIGWEMVLKKIKEITEV